MSILESLAPAEWWDSPASVTGRHHPPGQTQRQHALATFRAARWHWRRVTWKDTRRSHRTRRSFLIATICHDTGKQFGRDNHEMAGAAHALRTWPDLPLVAYLVLGHSARWGPSHAQRWQWMARCGDERMTTLDGPPTWIYRNRRSFPKNCCQNLSSEEWIREATLPGMRVCG